MKINDFNWKIGGQAGFGIVSSGLMFAKTITRGGLFVYSYVEKPSLIRGGHNTYQVYVNKKPIYSQRKQVDLLVALNSETIDLHLPELSAGSAVIVDSEKMKVDIAKLKRRQIKVYDIPFNKLAREAGGQEVMRNTVTLGATIALLEYDLSILEKVIKEQFSHKQAEIAKKNIKAARSGYRYIKENYNTKEFACLLKPQLRQKKLMVITANEAAALGAIAAGCKFYAAYPMTPASSILHTLAKFGPSKGMVVRQVEDEISAINAIQGASTAGVRSMLATSGGGFALMVEGVSLAGITETPIVIVEAMRGGPATGLPTWTEQADLQFVVSAGHGEFPRVVLAPGDAEEAFYLTALAFNLAELMQSPVIILLDKYISENHLSLPFFDTSKIKIKRGKILSDKEATRLGEKYRRYKVTKDGVSPRALPGQKGPVMFINSDEHDEMGFSEESADNRIAQVNKRARKIEVVKPYLPPAKLYGSRQSDITLVGWGSVKGPVVDALAWGGFKKKVNFVHFNCVDPLPANTVKLLQKAKRLVLVENNSTGQFAKLLRAGTGIEIKDKILRYDGRPFYPSELIQVINKRFR